MSGVNVHDVTRKPWFPDWPNNISSVHCTLSVVATIALRCTLDVQGDTFLACQVSKQLSLHTSRRPGDGHRDWRNIFSDSSNLSTIFLPDWHLARRSTYCQIILCNLRRVIWSEVQGRSSHSKCHPAWADCCEWDVSSHDPWKWSPHPLFSSDKEAARLCQSRSLSSSIKRPAVTTHYTVKSRENDPRSVSWPLIGHWPQYWSQCLVSVDVTEKNGVELIILCL